MTVEFRDPQTAKMVDFIRKIGLYVQKIVLTEETFLPGIKIKGETLLVDEEKLLYPGDLLHEAGHLAVLPPAQRLQQNGNFQGNPGSDEMMAIAWSYAAAVHLDIDPAVVFHPKGYKGASESLIDAFTTNDVPPGLPMLQWIGLTMYGEQAAAEEKPPYPHMLCWLRE